MRDGAGRGRGAGVVRRPRIPARTGRTGADATPCGRASLQVPEAAGRGDFVLFVTKNGESRKSAEREENSAIFFLRTARYGKQKDWLTAAAPETDGDIAEREDGSVKRYYGVQQELCAVFFVRLRRGARGARLFCEQRRRNRAAKYMQKNNMLNAILHHKRKLYVVIIWNKRLYF